MDFKVGDRVTAIHKEDGNEKIIGKSGTILKITNNSYAKVKFDQNINGWLGDECMWCVRLDKLKLLNEKQTKEVRKMTLKKEIVKALTSLCNEKYK